MILIILVAICLLACGFLLYVLAQWIRDGKRRPAAPQSTTEWIRAKGGKRQPLLITSRRIDKKEGQLPLKRSKASSSARQSKKPFVVCSRCERMAHDRIARALIAERNR